MSAPDSHLVQNTEMNDKTVDGNKSQYPSHHVPRLRHHSMSYCCTKYSTQITYTQSCGTIIKKQRGPLFAKVQYTIVHSTQNYSTAFNTIVH